MLQARDNEINLKYGGDMRVISVVTLIFLPGTFVATMFSTSFWDFSPDSTGPRVSKWIWIYWLLTTLLTVAVFAAWRNFLLLKASRDQAVNTWKQGTGAWKTSAEYVVSLWQQSSTFRGLRNTSPKEHVIASAVVATTLPERRHRTGWRTLKRRKPQSKEREKDLELAAGADPGVQANETTLEVVDTAITMDNIGRTESEGRQGK